MLSGKRRRSSGSRAHADSAAGNFADRAFLHALRELVKAFDYARLGKREVWDFAVEIQTLRDAGLTDSDFRWLTCVGHVDHACEVTFLGDDRRQFQRTGKLSFAKRTCFIL